MLMKIKEAAQYLATTEKAVRRLIRTGRLRLVLIDSDWRVDSADLDLFIARCKV